jgi:hypothetical protein
LKERILTLTLKQNFGLTKHRDNYEILGDGQGVHWPEIDEDPSVEGMFHGVPARRPNK